MLRAGPLSVPQLQERLRQEFVTAWVLAKDLPQFAAAARTPEARALAAAAHTAYRYPVDTQIWSAAGELLGQIGANDLFADPEADWETLYGRLLDAAAQR